MFKAEGIEAIREPNQYRHLLRYAQIAVCVLIWSYCVVSFFRNALAVYNNVGPDRNALDFLYFYSTGIMWNQGIDVYNPETFYTNLRLIGGPKGYWLQHLYYFLPPTSAMYSAFSSLDYASAFNIMWLINVGLIFLSLALLAVILSWFRRIGLLEITLLFLFLISPYGMVTMEVGQMAPLLCVLMLAAFVLFSYKRYTASAALLSLFIVKISFLPLYMGYFLLRRHYRAFVVGVILAGFLCILPLVLTQRPVVDTLIDWLPMIRQSQNEHGSNSPSPFERYSLDHIDIRPLMYRVVNSYTRAVTAVYYVTILALVLYSASLLMRSRVVTQKSKLLDFALVSMLTLVTVYHRSYDIFLAFPALLYIYVHTREQTSPKARRNWAIFTGAMFLVVALPYDTMIQIYYMDLSILQSSYLYRLVSNYQAWCNVVLIGVILWLKRQQVNQERESVPVVSEGAKLASA
jgi:hypothetical protein